MIRKTTLLFFIAFAAAAHVHAQTKKEQKVAAVVAQLSKAMIDADSAGLVSLVHDELSYAHSSGKTEDKAAFVSALTSGRSDFVTMHFADQKVRVVNRTATVRHTLTGQVVDGGKPTELKLNVLLVWVKKGGRWRLLARQAARLP